MKKGSLFAQRLRDAQEKGIVNEGHGFPGTFSLSSTNLVGKDRDTEKNSLATQIENSSQINEVPDTTNNLVQNEEKSQTESSMIQLTDIGTKNSPPKSSAQFLSKPKEGRQESSNLLDVLTESDIDSIQSQNMKTIQEMSPSELEEQRKLLLGLLSKENIDFLKKNKDYLQTRKEELKSSKKKEAIQLKPKSKSEKQKFMEAHAAATSIKSIIPDLSPEFFEDDLFDTFYYTCYFTNEGYPANNLTAKDLDESKNYFNSELNDDFHTFHDLTTLLDSQHPAQVVFSLDKICRVLSELVVRDEDWVEGFSYSGALRIPKMRLIRGLVEKGKIDLKCYSLTVKKNVNVLKGALDLARLLLKWVTLKSIRMSRKDPESLARMVGVVIGQDKDAQIHKWPFFEEDYLHVIFNRVQIEENPEIIGLIAEIIAYLRFWIPSKELIANITTQLDIMKTGTSNMKESLMAVERVLEGQTNPQITSTNQTAISPTASPFEIFSLLRSNLKHGAYLNTISLSFVEKEMEPSLKLSEILTFRASLYLPWSMSPNKANLIYIINQFDIVMNKKMIDLTNEPTETVQRALFHCTDIERISIYEDQLVKRDGFEDFLGTLNKIIENYSEEAEKSKKCTLLSLEFYVDTLPPLLMNSFSFMVAAEWLIVFNDIIEFYSKETSGRIIETSELLFSFLKRVSKLTLKEGIRQVSKDQARLKALCDNYNYCSFGDSAFTSLIFIFTSKYCKFDLVK